MTLYIVIITAVISLIALRNGDLMSKLIFDPYIIKHRGQWYRFISSGFLHANLMHLFVNMFVLYSFGQETEFYYDHYYGHSRGPLLFVLMYLSAMVAASASTYYKYQNSVSYRSLGASGAVSAVVFARILFNPYGKVYLYGILGLPGVLLGAGYLAYSYYMSKRQSDNVNHEAHFYGAIYGMLFSIAFKPALFMGFIYDLLSVLH